MSTSTQSLDSWNDYCNPPEFASQQEQAARLSTLAGGKIRVWHQPRSSYVDDRTSLGHLYAGALNCENEEEFIELDDRREEPLEVQLVAELRRISELYRTIADQVEQETRPGADLEQTP